MKICFIQPRAYELFNPKVKTQYGGAEVQMYLHAKELAKNEHLHISFMVADHGQPETEVYDQVAVHPSIRFGTPLLQQIKAFYRVFKKTDADIYLQMTLTRFSFLIALYCLLTGKKFVYLISHDNDLNGEILKSNFLFQKISLLVFLFSKKIIAQNIHQFNTLKKYGIHSKIIRSSLEGEPSFPEKKEYHLWVARTELWKNPEAFIRLAASHPDENFVMICPPFAESDPQFYAALVAKSKTTVNLKFIGEYISFSALDAYFSSAKTFVNTSDHEGFPTTFIHAAQHGIPVLSLSVNPDDLLTTQATGIYCHKDENELHQQFRLLLEDEKLYAAYSSNAVRYFKEYHELKKNSALLLDHITK